jgi:hypothetical protein
LRFLDTLSLLDYLELSFQSAGNGCWGRVMKSGSSGRRSPDDDADEVFDSRPEPPRSPAKGESSAAEFDEFDEEDFDDEFDDDFEEELEDEYELAEFEELTEDDLAADENADVTAMGDFVDEDAEPEEAVVDEEEGEKKDDGAKKKGKNKDEELEEEE